MRKLQVILPMVSALALCAGGALAQTVTELEVVDRPTLIITEVEFDLGLEASQDFARTSGKPVAKQAVQDQISRSMYGAANVIGETVGLDGVPRLMFSQPGNKAGVEQDGIHNNAAVDQEGGESGWAIVNQLGEDTSAQITQNDERRTIGSNSLNRAYVGQVAFNTPSGRSDFSQYAIINQTHRSTAGRDPAPNNAVVQQGGIRGVDNDDPTIMLTAIGENNVAQITQNGAGNDGLVQQGAENATSFRVQMGDTIGRNNRATLTQVGFGNRAVISQEDDSDAITRQFGFDNQAFVQQDGDVDASDQMSVIAQGGPFDVNGNFAAVRQRAFEAWSEIFQSSSDNEAYVDQDEPASYARSFMSQSGGSGNFMSLLQSTPTSFASQALLSIAFQNGSNNELYVVQRFSQGSSLVSQTGNNNLGRVLQ
jgi:hypothetical protein